MSINNYANEYDSSNYNGIRVGNITLDQVKGLFPGVKYCVVNAKTKIPMWVCEDYDSALEIVTDMRISKSNKVCEIIKINEIQEV